MKKRLEKKYDDVAEHYTMLKKKVRGERTFFDLLLHFLIHLTEGTPTYLGFFLRRLLYKLAFRKCGKGLIIHPYVVIKFPQKIEVGDYCAINQFSFINGLQGIKIGENVSISAGCCIISQTVQNERMEVMGFGKVNPLRFRPIEIGDNSWLACGTLIGPGVRIGKNSQIGANSVVLDDIPDSCFAAGTPARVIKRAKERIRKGDVYSSHSRSWLDSSTTQ